MQKQIQFIGLIMMLSVWSSFSFEFSMFSSWDMLMTVDTYNENGVEYSLIEYTVTEDREWYVTKFPKTETIVIRDNVKGEPVVGIFNIHIAEKFFVGPRKIVLPNTIKRIEDGAFYNFSTLEEINIPDSVTYIGEFAFGKCLALENITLPEGLTVINDMLFEESGIKNVNVPKSVVSIGYKAFYNCEELRSIDLHDGIVSLGISSFENCINLREIHIPNNIEFRSILDHTFNNCQKLLHLELPYYVNEFGDKFFPSVQQTAPNLPTIVYHNKKQKIWLYFFPKQSKKFEPLPKKEEAAIKKEIAAAEKQLKLEMKRKIGQNFEPGNHYGEYGEKMTLQTLSKEIGWLRKKKALNTEMTVFREKPGKGSGFYTGQKENGGDIYTWSARTVQIDNYGDLVRAGALFTEPVYIDYENKTLPLTAVVDDEGNIVSDVGKGSDDPIYASVDIVEKADIWYITGLENDIRNQYSKVCAYSVLVGKCAEARANANELLLRDIEKLCAAIKTLEDDIAAGSDGDIAYSAVDLTMKRERVDKLKEQLMSKIKIYDDLTGAIKEAMAFTRKQEAKLAGYIARDVAIMTGYSTLLAVATAGMVAAGFAKTKNEEAEKLFAFALSQIIKYAIKQYGPTKRIQQIGKNADQYAKINKAAGAKLMKDAEKKLDEQQKKRDAIYADLGLDAGEQLNVKNVKKSIAASDKPAKSDIAQTKTSMPAQSAKTETAAAENNPETSVQTAVIAENNTQAKTQTAAESENKRLTKAQKKEQKRQMREGQAPSFAVSDDIVSRYTKKENTFYEKWVIRIWGITPSDKAQMTKHFKNNIASGTVFAAIGGTLFLSGFFSGVAFSAIGAIYAGLPLLFGLGFVGGGGLASFCSIEYWRAGMIASIYRKTTGQKLVSFLQRTSIGGGYDWEHKEASVAMAIKL